MNKKNVTKPARILQVKQDRDYDCVYLHGKKIILGRTGTPEADAAFRQLQIQVLADPTFSAPKLQQVTVDCLYENPEREAVLDDVVQQNGVSKSERR